MPGNAKHALEALNEAFLRSHPSVAMEIISALPADGVIELLESQPEADLIRIWDNLLPDMATSALQQLSGIKIKLIMQRGDSVRLSRVLVRLEEEVRLGLMALIDASRQRELSLLVEYPENSAGSLMDPRFIPLYETLTAREALHRIRKLKSITSRQLYLIDKDGLLRRMVEIHNLALAEPEETLASLSQHVPAFVTATATREEVVEQMELHRISGLPVVDIAGRLIGLIRHDALVEAMREESSVDMLTMFGASRDERALSNISFVVRKRLPWLSINLLTAFLAASVVGLFEATIAQFTALAILLPVVAGQSGNTGAQALAVTMRGLALREIGTSQWLKVARKEVGAAFFNGLAIALLTAIGVLVWNGSEGLALVIAVSMVFSMLAAALSGVVIPVTLSSLGQDPAQSSSIILTTVTDVVGFFSFLGIATLLSGLL